MIEKIKMRDGDTMLIMVKDGEVIHFTPNMSLPHSEFVKRATGQLPGKEHGWEQFRGSTARSSPSVQNISSATSFPRLPKWRRR